MFWKRFEGVWNFRAFELHLDLVLEVNLDEEEMEEEGEESEWEKEEAE